MIVLAETGEVGITDDDVNVGDGEPAVIMYELAYFANGSEAPSWSCSCADCTSTHCTVGES